LSGNQAVAGQRITAAWLNLNIPGAWQAVTLQNGWTNHGGTSVTFQARQYNSVTLEVIGILQSGTVTINTTIGTLPVSLPRPVSTQSAWAAVIAGTGTGPAFALNVLADGTINLGEAVTGNEIGFHFFVSLDA
jgi:hypothetical protein